MSDEQLVDDYRRIEQAIIYIERNRRRQPTLKQVADSVGLSEYHFQRLFGRWVGISPKRFLQFLTVEHAKGLLEEARDLLDVTYETGLSGPGRLHDLFVNCEAVTPGQFKNKGDGLVITYGFHPSPFGECLLALTERGICGLAFCQEGQQASALAALAGRWERATLREDAELTRPFVDRIFGSLKTLDTGPLHLVLKGTNFQIKVWEALLRIPTGCVVSYQDVARYIGMPNAVRAVGHAVGQNPIAYIIPCHRVIHKSGVLGNYRWGAARKKAMLGWEAAVQERKATA